MLKFIETLVYCVECYHGINVFLVCWEIYVQVGVWVNVGKQIAGIKQKMRYCVQYIVENESEEDLSFCVLHNNLSIPPTR